MPTPKYEGYANTMSATPSEDLVAKLNLIQTIMLPLVSAYSI